MLFNKLAFWITLLIWLTVLVLLLTGSKYLLLDWGGIPSGTILTWAGLICLPLSIYFGSQPLRESQSFGFRVIRKFFVATVVVALAWGVVAYFLAGNWSFNFAPKEEFVGSTQAYHYFYLYTVVALGMSILLLFWLSTFIFLLKRRQK